MSDTLPPLPDFSPSFRPRWLSDNGGFTADQMRSYASAAVAAERERKKAAAVEVERRWLNLPDSLRRHPGLKSLYRAATET
jgi:hypothetical protein